MGGEEGAALREKVPLAGDRRKSCWGHRPAQRSQIKWKRGSRAKEHREKKMQA